ncbi:MAG: archease [Nitrospirae bacterium]|nr:archease [Nitrospirota bacterium]
MMTKGFRFLEDIALADLAFEAWGESPSELFASAAEALMEAMANPSTVGTEWKHDLDLSEPNLPDLLFEWLSIFVFLKDAEAVVFHDVLAEVWQDPDAQTWHVHGEIVGDTISATSQELRADVKAITKHLYQVHGEPGHYHAQVVLDV